MIALQSDRQQSSGDSISTFIRRIPYEREFPAGVVYSILNYVSSDETIKILQSIKGHGPYHTKPGQVERFIKLVADACAPLITRLKPDVIIYPKSGSALVKDFAKALGARNSKIVILDDAFIKKAVSAEQVHAMINTDHPAWGKFSLENPGAVSKLSRSLERQLKDHGTLELKKLYKPYVKFIKNFLELKNAYETLDTVLGKSVLVVDDILSSGTTMNEMLRQLAEMEPSSVAGLTIFKRTKTPLEK